MARLRVVAIIGPSSSGKSRLTRDLASYLGGHGRAAVGISLGYVFRALAILGYELRSRGLPREQPTVADIIAAASAMRQGQPRLTLDSGWPCLDGSRLSRDQLREPRIESRASELGAEPALNSFVLGLVRRQVDSLASVGGYVILDGRGLHRAFPDAYRIHLSVGDAEAVRRSGRTLEAVQARNRRDSSHAHGLPAAGPSPEGVQLHLLTDGLSCDHVFGIVLPHVLEYFELQALAAS